MRKKQLIKYCSELEERNLKLRRENDEVKRGADQVSKAVDAILAEVVKKFGDFEIDMPVVGNTVDVQKDGEKLVITAKKDAQGPYACGGDEKCQEVKADTTRS